MTNPTDVTYPTEDDLRIRRDAVLAAAHVMNGVVGEVTDTSWTEVRTVQLAKRLERYLREGE